jgi:3-methyladenine DNA glycosylase AlkD
MPPSPRATAKDVQAALRKLADPRRAKSSATFFKTGPGQYGEGDIFLGIRVPDQRKIAQQFRDLPLPEIGKLLESKYHEDRLTGLTILVGQYESGDAAARGRVCRFYLQNTRRINNWDLVDSSARYIAGEHLRDKSRKALYKLVRSKNLWERRIAMVATHAWIAKGDTEDAYKIAERLLGDKEDLMHKAVGWMLREAGRHSRETLLAFLETNYARVPRTALRYAIEHLPAEQRERVLAGNFADAPAKYLA